MKRYLILGAALFALSGCAPFFAAAVYHVASGFTGDSGVVTPIDCYGPGCDADKTSHKAVHEPSAPPVADDPGDDDDAPGKPDKPKKDRKPGHGHGDKNHKHDGPPGHHK